MSHGAPTGMGTASITTVLVTVLLSFAGLGSVSVELATLAELRKGCDPL